MASWEGTSKFLSSIIQLQSFAVFSAYLILIPLSFLCWQRVTRPFNIRWVLVVYNFTCSILSCYTLCGFIYGLVLADHIYLKESTAPLKPFFFMYWVTKNLELLDTVFMIVRHRRRQITFLHIYHHASMVLLSEYAYQFASWPAIATILGLNSFVHVFLYLYYGLCALYPSNPPAWKRRITELQILQFLIDLVYAAVGYLRHGFCIYGFHYGILMIGLFSNFYYQAYLRPKGRKEKVT